ncbi:alkylated DNA repair protein alkB like protein 4 [Trypanosoma grayi]|uniref:alkylated DNA repair protein alkB like protein 4 n=1 Tax=Trypanosoma grayi TaxID=71804 RepID=UPI0004F4B14A|nr:alkylated DNA repair protein alkB like protein 4 [Trypanosoma grayi]KEG11407.1 alkylated DNA repair protein alkB like protein 4 [Trypanosoma grayi]
MKEGCCCSGIRFCDRCISSDRAQAIIHQSVDLTKASDVVSQQYGSERTSSCSFAVVGPSLYSFCWECSSVFQMHGRVVRSCADHVELSSVTNLSLAGLFVAPDFLSLLEEEKLVMFFDNPSSFPGWKPSQSGRRKQDFGPRANFKKRKLRVPGTPWMPQQLKDVLGKVSSFVTQQSGKPFCIVEASVLEYTSENSSSIDPHIDDTWLWGDRIGGLNLLEDAVMTFVHGNGTAVDVFIPRGAFFLLSKDSRFIWMHGIRQENIRNRRISITVRELAEDLEVDAELLKTIMENASSFV